MLRCKSARVVSSWFRRRGGLRGIWIRRLLPAGVVSVVLAFSYFLPVLGDVAPGPVQHASGVNCGRFGYGYHGGKHMFICPNRPFPGHVAQAVSSDAAKPAVGSATSGTTSSEPATVPARTATERAASVSTGFTQWRAFTGLVLQELD